MSLKGCAYTMEAVILQIATTFVKGKGRIIFGSSSKVYAGVELYCSRDQGQSLWDCGTTGIVKGYAEYYMCCMYLTP